METSLWRNGLSSLSSLFLIGEPTKFSLLHLPATLWNLLEVSISEITVTDSNLVETLCGICSYKAETHIDTYTQRERETHTQEEKRKILYDHRNHVFLRNSRKKDQVLRCIFESMYQYIRMAEQSTPNL